MVATVQEGKSALVRIWDAASAQCLAILCGHASGMSCVDLSGDGRALLAVGLDTHNKQQITLWDISDVRATRRAQVLLKNTTEYNIKRAKFSPYEPDKFMTVGKDSVRLYRIKNGALRGLSIQVSDHCFSIVSGRLLFYPTWWPGDMVQLALRASHTACKNCDVSIHHTSCRWQTARAKWHRQQVAWQSL